MTKRIMVLNGPNLNMLGIRQPEVYGKDSLQDVETLCRSTASNLGYECDCRQSNHEGELIDWIHEARGNCAGIVINPGAYTHTSVAIMDAFISVELPVVEIHVSNIHQRETFRHTSYVSKVAFAVIAGFGVAGYRLAVDGLIEYLE